MILHSLRLHDFRAHHETRLALTPKVNLLYGPNGAGKTNVLEAVHFLCLTKSFLTGNDSYALRRGSRFFEIEGTFESRRRPEIRVRLAYVPEEGKRIFINGAPPERLADVVGMLPVVVYSPEDHALTAGGPDERRRFLNNLLSQARPVYLDDLLKYRRALKQRNELLGQYRRRRATPPAAILEPWDAEVADLGSRIIAARHRFLSEFQRFLDEAYGQISHVAEQPTMRYETAVELDDGDDTDAVRAKYGEALKRAARREVQRGVTLVGPHRDELVFTLDDLEVRRHASQGQHRTLGMALKLAKYAYLRERLDEPPLLLLDDVFDHLDARRSAAFLELVQSDAVQQTIITATARTGFEATVPFEAPEHQAVRIANGKVDLAPAGAS